MKKGFVVGVIVIAVILLLVISFTGFGTNEDSSISSETGDNNQISPAESSGTSPNKDSSDSEADSSDTETIPEENPSGPVVNSVEMSSSGFSPKTLTIKKGESVSFVNIGSETHWPATAVHPTHTVYPNSDIRNCDEDFAEIMFDSCKGIGKGEVYKFTFNEKGSWNYHDHLNPGFKGTIIIE